MEHNPFMTLTDDTEITYSDLKKKLAHNKAESIEDSFGKYQISDIHQGDYVRFWWRWVSKTGKNRIHEGIVLAVNSYDRKCPTLDVMSEGILYNNIEIYFVIECFDGGKHYE